MGVIQSHRDLLVWQKGMDLVESVYILARGLPKSEQFGLTSQLTRAAVSVPANIVEGHSRGSRKDYAHFLTIARGSLAETETLLLICVRVGYVTNPQIQPLLTLLETLSKMLTSLRNKLLTPTPVP